MAQVDKSRFEEIADALDNIFAKAGVVPEVRKQLIDAMATAPPVPGLALGAGRKLLGQQLQRGVGNIVDQPRPTRPLEDVDPFPGLVQPHSGFNK